MPALLLGLCASADTVSAQIRVNGAVALGHAIRTKQAQIETQSGEKIVLLGHSAGLGLQDLIAGRADLAMVTGSLKGCADGLNASNPGSVNIEGMKAFVVGHDPVAFIVHPTNPVKSLTLEQIAGILAGRTKNWKEIGGNDAPIQLFSLGALNGPRIAVGEQLLRDEKFRADAVVRNSAKDMAPIIAQMPNAFGYVGSENLVPGVTRLATDRTVLMPMLLVAKGEPSPAQQRVIDATKSAIDAAKSVTAQ